MNVVKLTAILANLEIQRDNLVTEHSVLKGGGFSKLLFHENKYLYLLYWVEC